MVSSPKAYNCVTSTSTFWSYTQFSTVTWNCTLPSSALSTPIDTLRHCPALQPVISFVQFTATYSGASSAAALLYCPESTTLTVFDASTALK